MEQLFACASATQYDRLSLGRRGLKPMQQHLPRHVMSRLLFELFHVHLTHEEERALGNRFSSRSGDFVDCNALQDQFLQLARDGLREDRVGKSAGSNKKSDGPEEAQDVKARKAVDLMFGSESSFEDEEESMEELMSTLRKEIEDNLKERVGVNKYAVELNQHTTSNLVLTNLKRAKIQAREKQLTKDLNKYVRKVSDDIMSQWSQERAGSDPGRLVGDVQLALAALNGDDDEAETADLERSSILIHLKNAVSDKALKARFETISDELERERGLAMIDAWKDFGVLPKGPPAVRRQQGAAGRRLQQRLARAFARLRRVVARADDGGLADVLRRAAPRPRLPSRPFLRKPAVPRRHPYERFLSLFRHEVHYLRSGATLWHGAGPASPVFFSSAPAPDLFP